MDPVFPPSLSSTLTQTLTLLQKHIGTVTLFLFHIVLTSRTSYQHLRHTAIISILTLILPLRKSLSPITSHLDYCYIPFFYNLIKNPHFLQYQRGRVRMRCPAADFGPTHPPPATGAWRGHCWEGPPRNQAHRSKDKQLPQIFGHC